MELLLLALLGGGLVWYFGSKDDMLADDSVPASAVVRTINTVSFQAYPDSDPLHIEDATADYYVVAKDVDVKTGVIAYTASQLQTDPSQPKLRDALSAQYIEGAKTYGPNPYTFITRTRDVNAFAHGARPDPWMIYLYPVDGYSVAAPGSKYIAFIG